MNRELKFRLWDISGRCWVNPNLLEVWNDSGILEPSQYIKTGTLNPLYTPIENYVIQQYTNLKDKNNKEIYEGDIVKYQNLIGVLKYSDEFMAFFIDTQIGSHLYGINFTKNEKNNFEVIGNIFENPELLKV